VTKIRFARRALREIDRVEAWSRANRSTLWPLFVSELAQAVRLLRVAPELGPEYEQAERSRGVRRLLLEETQYYAYYRYHSAKALVVVLCVWSTRRRRAPSLK
jgi:plasmid stabilization system protein ParE